MLAQHGEALSARGSGVALWAAAAAADASSTHFKAYLQERIEAARPRWIPAVVLLREIRRARLQRRHHAAEGVASSPLSSARTIRSCASRRAPGEQMQADFTMIRRGRDPLLAFVATLGYSRATLVRFTTGEDARRCARACARR